ncbi:DoxX family protein [Frondihabitans australicus]|uniref:Putative membrane protein n=1 Tax=Frondihabitans australicus TaxID=386892 RepID=A0A495IHW7_9MICO|nr:MauE/DoxX family redox-associated membrane protein [Frondihabitans australicus]RKR75573.1 putative membrane protein [Frondihabitans australicus]
MHPIRTLARLALGAVLVFAGVSHLSFARQAFRAQVPKSLTDNLPVSEDDVVVASGVAEIGLGGLLLLVNRRWVGTLAAVFFVAVFPGNIAQLVNRRTAFGLDTNDRRLLRLLGQPLLVAVALAGRPKKRS